MCAERLQSCLILMLETNHARSLEVSAMLTRQEQLIVLPGLEDLLQVSTQIAITHVLLRDTSDRGTLQMAAETVRRRWPRARILVLGVAAAVLEDNLYDDTLREPLGQEELLNALNGGANVLERRWSSGVFPALSSRRSYVRLSESDPSKVGREAREGDGRERDKPGEVERRKELTAAAGLHLQRG